MRVEAFEQLQLHVGQDEGLSHWATSSGPSPVERVTEKSRPSTTPRARERIDTEARPARAPRRRGRERSDFETVGDHRAAGHSWRRATVRSATAGLPGTAYTTVAVPRGELEARGPMPA